MTKTKGKPRRDGSGQGRRANKGRGGCNPPRDGGRGQGYEQSRGRRRM